MPKFFRNFPDSNFIDTHAEFISIFPDNRPDIDFGRVGLYYIMFLAGLEMDMEGLKKNRNRVMIFGMLTFLVPFAMTYFMGVSLLGYLPLASLLLTAIMASNTLIAYPIVGRYRLMRFTSSTLSVGSSMMALFMALIVMASIVNSFHGNGGILFWLLFILKFVAYCVGLIMVMFRSLSKRLHPRRIVKYYASET